MWFFCFKSLSDTALFSIFDTSLAKYICHEKNWLLLFFALFSFVVTAQETSFIKAESG